MYIHKSTDNISSGGMKRPNITHLSGCDMKFALKFTSWYGRENSVESSLGVSPYTTGSLLQLVTDVSTRRKCSKGCFNLIKILMEEGLKWDKT